MRGLIQKLIIIVKRVLNVPSLWQFPEFDKQSRSSLDDNIINLLSGSILSYSKKRSPPLVIFSSSGIRISCSFL